MAKVMTNVAVRRFPDRKKPCLVIEQGNQGMILATFNNEKTAKLFDDLFGICITESEPLFEKESE